MTMTPEPPDALLEPTERDLERVVAALRGMAYEHRFRILVVLMLAVESSPAELAEALPLDGTIVAHHLRHLLDAKLIRRQRRGRRVFYTLSDDATRRLVGEVLRYAGRRA
jgi:DNA-binding transcriptional ArsR family regulator